MTFKEKPGMFGYDFGRWYIAKEEFDEERDLMVSVKVVDKPAEGFGIDGGRIIKLEIRIGREIIANYDRGWGIRVPEEAQMIYESVLDSFN